MKVDIIVPTYNRHETLLESLDSIRSQTYPHWKCWIAEDGKTHKTFEVIKSFLEDDRFEYMPGKHSGSPAHPRNRGVQLGNFEYIAFLDDDDIWLPKKLENQLDFMQRHPDCVLLGCNAYRWSGSKTWNSSTPLYFQKKRFWGKIPYEAFVQDNHLIISSVMIRRKVLKQSGLFNENLSPLEIMAEDYELWLRIGVFGEIWNLEEPCVVYRDTPLTYYSKLNRKQNYESRARILDSALKTLETNLISNPKSARHLAACRYERDFYLAGPRFLGRLRHEIVLKIKNRLSIPL